MKYLKKEFKTSRQAENYLNKLYGMYNQVRLIGFPPNTEGGIYIFEIK
jgi:hypothetical protein